MSLTTAQLIDRYGAPVPRYTSYPTAPHFHAGIDIQTYARWLRTLPWDATLSLYFHIPFCDRLCWFCGCHTKHTLRYEPVASYLKALHAEINWVADQLDGKGLVTAIHLGGGSPTLLKPQDLINLRQLLDRRFTLSPLAEISIEIDPNDLDEGLYDGLAEFGLTRASIGVQDFDPKVQQAINRRQSFEQTQRVVEAVRARGVHSVNLDLVYGLPHQTRQSLQQTIDLSLSLTPDRCALFGYAHVPWLKSHQKMIDDTTLPDIYQRFEQAQAAGQELQAAGLVAIGFDHFAKPSDSLAKAASQRRLRRNFQGYTDDAADALLGFGASAIGQLPQGYVQNTIATNSYITAVDASGSATAKGISLTDADRLNRHAIETLLCQFEWRASDFHAYGRAGAMLFERAVNMTEDDADGLLALIDNSVVVTTLGKPFVRAIAARFDAYFTPNFGKYSSAI